MSIYLNPINSNVYSFNFDYVVISLPWTRNMPFEQLFKIIVQKKKNNSSRLKTKVFQFDLL